MQPLHTRINVLCHLLQTTFDAIEDLVPANRVAAFRHGPAIKELGHLAQDDVALKALGLTIDWRVLTSERPRLVRQAGKYLEEIQRGFEQFGSLDTFYGTELGLEGADLENAKMQTQKCEAQVDALVMSLDPHSPPAEPDSPQEESENELGHGSRRAERRRQRSHSSRSRVEDLMADSSGVERDLTRLGRRQAKIYNGMTHAGGR